MPNFLNRLFGGRTNAPSETKSFGGHTMLTLSQLGPAQWSGRGYASLVNQGFMRNPIVYRCIRLIAEAANRVPLAVEVDGRRMSDHPLALLLSRPNGRQSGGELLEAVYAYLQTAGNAYLQAGIVEGTVRTLFILRPDRMSVVAGRDGWPVAYDYKAGGRAVRIEGADRTIEGTTWSVAGLGRGDVAVVSTHDGGPAYGGTPSDASVLAAIADLKARGLMVTLYPFILMDVPAGNGLPDPHGGAEQGAYPWRGRITCQPAPGQPGSPDGTAAAAAQVAAFVPGYRAMTLHYAGLALAAGGVDTLVIGSEMVGLTTVRGADNSFPFVQSLISLAADVRAVVGSGTKLTYAADWTEYSGYQGPAGKFFHLDPLWASSHIDAVGIDCYFPLADWRDGETHADAALAASTHDLEYLQGNIAGGEGHDWYYASPADRRAQLRTPITDGTHGEPWVWRFKDIRSFWSQPHRDRPGGVRNAQPTAWIPGSKPIWLMEVGVRRRRQGCQPAQHFRRREECRARPTLFLAGYAGRADPAPAAARPPSLLAQSGWQSGRHGGPGTTILLDLGRAAVSGLSGTGSHLGGWRQPPDRALAHRAARRPGQ